MWESVVQWQITRLRVVHAFLEMFTADGDVAFVATDFNLGAFAQDGSIGVGAQHHRGFAAAVADGFYFDEIIGPREQVLAAL